MKRSTILLAPVFILFALLTLSGAANAQVVYGISAIGEIPDYGVIDGYSATELDYYAYQYYDAYVEGYHYMGNTLVDAGGYQGGYLAEVYTESTARPANIYTLISDHWVLSYYYVEGYGWYDAYGYDQFGGEYGGGYSFYGCVCPAYVGYDYIYLGSTGVQIGLPQFSVQLQRGNGSSVPSPLRIGFLEDLDLQLVVTPASAAINVFVGTTVQGRIGITNVQTTSNVVKFWATARIPSQAPGDEFISARYAPDGTEVRFPVSVVDPYTIARPHDTIGGGVVIFNDGFDKNSIPPIYDIPSNQTILGTAYLRNLKLKVVDRFGDGVGESYLYGGSTIYEKKGSPADFLTTKQTLSADSFYTDPVGTIVPRTDGPVFIFPDTEQGRQELNNWRNSTYREPLRVASETQHIEVSVDALSLYEPIDRVINYAPPNTVTIIWP